MVVFLASSSTTSLYRGRAQRQSVQQFYVLLHMRQSWETMTSVSAGHIILTPIQTVGSGRPQRESNPVPPHQESRALPTELSRPPQRESERERGGGGRCLKHQPSGWMVHGVLNINQSGWMTMLFKTSTNQIGWSMVF